VWSADGKTLVTKTRGYVPADGLYWIEAETGEVLNILYESEAPSRAIANPFPIADTQKVGFLAGENYYQYDLLDGSISTTQWANRETIRQWGLLHQISGVSDGPVDVDICLRE